MYVRRVVKGSWKRDWPMRLPWTDVWHRFYTENREWPHEGYRVWGRSETRDTLHVAPWWIAWFYRWVPTHVWLCWDWQQIREGYFFFSLEADRWRVATFGPFWWRYFRYRWLEAKVAGYTGEWSFTRFMWEYYKVKVRRLT